MNVRGPNSVAGLLRALADDVESGLVGVDGHEVELGPVLRATVEVPDDPQETATVVDVRLVHPNAEGWELTRLRAALSHPGD